MSLETTVEYVNTVSGAKISGTVYNQLKKELKSKYTKVKASKATKKKTATPTEAK